MTPEQRMVELLRKGLHVPAGLRELVARCQGMAQTMQQKALADGYEHEILGKVP